MRWPILVAAIVFCSMPSVFGQSGRELVGKIEPDLVPDWLDSVIPMTQADASALATLGVLRPPRGRVWSGEVEIAGQKKPIYLIESGVHQLRVAADLDGDGRLSKKESVPLGTATKDDEDEQVTLAATIRFSTPSAIFRSYPLHVGLVAAPASGSGKEQNAAPRVYLRRSSQAFISGTILIDGKSTILHVSVGSKSLSFNLAKGYQYIDCNGDGKIDDMSTSFEMGFAKGGPVVFHVGSGDRYVSIERIDVARKAVTLAVHPKSDYDRIELQVGREVPDFEFIALDGSKRHLSDFRGKYLLMDFWGTWCGPCVGDLPLIKKAYDTYKDKGFEVLGMDTELPDVTAEDFEKGLAKVKAFVAERGIPWLQARTESIKPLYERRFMIVAYPTYVLLGPDGTIIRLSGLHGEELGKTLAALFNGK